MKRGWIGAALLLVLLAVGSFSAWDMAARQQPLEEAMDQAAQHALAQNREEAQSLVQWARQQWHAHWRRNAAVSDHGPMEEIDSLFAQLDVLDPSEDPLAYALICAQLAEAFSALGEGHIPNWWNLL